MIENAKIVSLLKDISEKENIKDYLLVIYGQFNQEIVVSAIKLIEKKLILEQFPRSVITKTKMICTEMLQNITKHQKSHETILPYFIVGTSDKTLNILSGNIITKESCNVIEAKLLEYGSVDRLDFRDYYIEAFKNAVLSNEGNAGLGLLEIFYRANQNVKYKMQNVTNELISFNLDVIVNKQLIGGVI
jgi:hypothetical protein